MSFILFQSPLERPWLLVTLLPLCFGCESGFAPELEPGSALQFDVAWAQGPVDVGTGPRGFLWLPAGVAVDASGRIYVADTQNRRLVKFDSRGVPMASAGSAAADTSAQLFLAPYGVATLGDQYVYVVDNGRDRVQVLNANDLTPAFTFGHAGTGPGELNSPIDVYVDEARGRVLVSAAHRVTFFSETGAFIDTLDTAGVTLLNPYGVCVDRDGVVYVVDHSHGNIKIFEEGAPPDSMGAWDGEVSLLQRGRGVTIDEETRRLFVADGDVTVGALADLRGEVQVYDLDSREALGLLPNATTGGFEFEGPWGVVWTSRGELVVVERLWRHPPDDATSAQGRCVKYRTVVDPEWLYN